MNNNELMLVFIGPRAEKYMKKWSNNRWYFCWAGFFFGVFWLLYRKMYMFTVYMVLISLMMGSVIYTLGFSIEYNLMINVLISLIIGFLGHLFYRTHVRVQLKKFTKSSKNDLKMLGLTGGVTWSVPITWLFLQVVAGVFLLLPWIQHTYFPQPKLSHIEYYEIR